MINDAKDVRLLCVFIATKTWLGLSDLFDSFTQDLDLHGLSPQLALELLDLALRFSNGLVADQAIVPGDRQGTVFKSQTTPPINQVWRTPLRLATAETLSPSAKASSTKRSLSSAFHLRLPHATGSSAEVIWTCGPG